MKFSLSSIAFLCIVLIPISPFFAQNFPSFFKQNGLWGLKNQKGVQILAPKYTNEISPEFSLFNNNYALVEINKKFGFVDRVGKEVVPGQQVE